MEPNTFVDTFRTQAVLQLGVANMSATTDNGASSYSTTASARVDLFSKMTRDVIHNPLLEIWISKSHKESRLDTFKIAINNRDCRGGSGDRDPSFAIFRWFSKNDPEMLRHNIQHLPFFGRWLDLFELWETTSRDQIVKIVVEQLQKDSLDAREGKSISLLAKWIPSERSKFDKKSKICKALAKALYDLPRRGTRYELERLRKEYLTPLREHLKIVERDMCSNNWDKIDYEKVPSVCMNRSKQVFMTHDPERFQKYLDEVQSGEKKINSSQVYPHELVCQYLSSQSDEIDEVIEAQWKGIVEATKKLGTLENTLVISDVSGSMFGSPKHAPINVSIALGLLISECVAEPFKGSVITFDSNPTFFQIKGETLKERVRHIQSAPWGMSTNIQAVFDLILERATSAPPKRLVILSDMQFDAAIELPDKSPTTLDTIQQKYKNLGYKVPEIVFWNLRSNTTSDFVGSSDEKGVCMISGFSPNLLRSVIEARTVTPYEVMRTALDNPRYDCITLPLE